MSDKPLDLPDDQAQNCDAVPTNEIERKVNMKALEWRRQLQLLHTHDNYKFLRLTPRTICEPPVIEHCVTNSSAVEEFFVYVVLVGSVVVLSLMSL